MALYTRTGMAPAIRKPNRKPEATQGTGDWVDEFAKVMEARRAGQKMREGKPLILSKNKPIKLRLCLAQTRPGRIYSIGANIGIHAATGKGAVNPERPEQVSHTV